MNKFIITLTAIITTFSLQARGLDDQVAKTINSMHQAQEMLDNKSYKNPIERIDAEIFRIGTRIYEITREAGSFEEMTTQEWNELFSLSERGRYFIQLKKKYKCNLKTDTGNVALDVTIDVTIAATEIAIAVIEISHCDVDRATLSLYAAYEHLNDAYENVKDYWDDNQNEKK